MLSGILLQEKGQTELIQADLNKELSRDRQRKIFWG